MCSVSRSVLASANLTHTPHPHRRCCPALTTHQSRKVVPTPNLVDLLLQSQGPLLRLELQRGVTLQEAAVPASAHHQQAAGLPNIMSTAHANVRCAHQAGTTTQHVNDVCRRLAVLAPQPLLAPSIIVCPVSALLTHCHT